jgi:hypothetical protein
VFWFRRAHDELEPGKRAGLVGTNTIRQNYSREGGLDYIVRNGGTITEAVSSQVWSGDAVVHVSIVNWIKGTHDGKKRLFLQRGDDRDSPWEIAELDEIGPALSFDVDVTQVAILRANSTPKQCFQGQTHGNDGFLLSEDEARAAIREEPAARAVLFPYLTADELVGSHQDCWRYVIDFGARTQPEARQYRRLFDHVQKRVLPDRQAAAAAEQKRNQEALAADSNASTTHDHEGALAKWWLLFRSRGEMLQAVGRLPRYVVCGRVTKRPIFEFIDVAIHANDALMVFPFADDYSFGVLQSTFHWEWFINRCSTMKGDPRYTSNTVFSTFPWPQGVPAKAVVRVATAARDLRKVRHDLRERHRRTLRDLYREIESPGNHPLRDAQAALDDVVAAAYGAGRKESRLAFLLKQNGLLAAAEKSKQQVDAPGLPARFASLPGLSSHDCLKPPKRL